MNTSHHDGGAPDVFSKNASAATTNRRQRTPEEELALWLRAVKRQQRSLEEHASANNHWHQAWLEGQK